jgi:hypothetical protein
MFRRIGITIVMTLFAVFGLGHVRALVTHGQLGCAPAAAQEGWNVGGESADSTEPDKSKAPPSVAGDWSGDIDDHIGGEGTIEFAIDQTGKNLSGTWSATFGGGDFTGTISSNGALKLDLSASSVTDCHLSAKGKLVGSDQIKGTYKVEDCGTEDKGDHGTFDISD